MPLVWVTGNSGAGKSTVAAVLRGRGFTALDSDDDGLCRWVDRTSGQVVIDPPYPVPEGWLDRYGWRIDRERIAQLAAASDSRLTFLCGSAENEAEVRDLFDLVICLLIDDDTLRRRLATRTDNAFGQHPEELAAALYWNPRTRAKYARLGATLVDATVPIERVADAVIEAVSRL